ncbi:MAG TPA: PAS-domain containing protein [Candidatus Udaeobacter sp.]|nr:PAS-domain containing protein [Candidatus Udaeobacter sp.]
MADSSAALKALLDCIGDGVCILDGAGLVVAANGRLAELLDFPPGFLRPGDPAKQLSDQMRRVAGIGLSAAGEPVKPFRHEARRPDGPVLEIRGDPAPAGGFVVTVADVTERHRLRATEDMLRQALDAIADGFAVFDPSDRLVMMNKLYIGYDPMDAEGPRLGITFDDLMRQDRRHGFYPDVAGHETPFIEDRIAAHREGVGRPINFRTSDGRWAQARDYRMLDGSTVVVRTDVSELVERDRSLRESQASLAAAQRIAKLGSWELDLADLDDLGSNPLRWSDETFRIFGYEPNQIEVSNEGFFRAVHPDDKEKIREAVGRAIKTGVAYSIEHRVIRPDGSEIVVHERSDIVSDPDGRPVKMVGTIQDVTEQRAAERKRDEFRALLEATSEASADGILVTDAEGRYLFWNRRFKEMWNLSDAYLERRRSAGLGPGADVSPFTDQIVEPRLILDEIGRIYHRNESPNARIADIALKDGRVFDRHAARVAAGKLPYATVAWIYRDVSDQRKQGALLAETERLTAVGEMAGGMAHELNNLLLVIGGNLELIETQERGSEAVPTMQYIATANAAVERGAELISHLLIFSRRQPLMPRLLDVNAFLADMMNVMARLLGHRVALKFRPGDGLWQTIVDPGFLQTTLVSLATNARDAMPSGGTLVIETANRTIDRAEAEAGAEATAGEYVLITVSDDGAGMPQEVAKRAFEPFFTTKPVGKGTGLGLSVVYGFVKQSGGHVAIRSALGQGTAIAIYLPRALSEPAAAAEASAAPAARGNQESILLVEDDPAVRAVARAFLRDLGYRVLEAENGEKALEVLRSAEPIDLLFTDIALSDGLNGAEIARAAETLRPGLKVLFTSGRTEEALVHQGGLEPGAKLLAKPYRKRDLASAIGALL